VNSIPANANVGIGDESWRDRWGSMCGYHSQCRRYPEYVLMFMAKVGLGCFGREGELNESCAFENPANELAEVNNVWVF